MARTQTQEEKDRFFAELERLGESSSGSETETEDEEIKKQVMATSRACRRMTPSPKYPTIDSKFVPPANGRSPSKNTSRSAANAASGTRRSDSRPQVIDLTSPDVPRPLKASKIGARQPPPAPQPKKRKQVEKSEVRPAKRAKKDKYEPKMQPEEKRIFKDLLFFFVPNYIVGPIRRLRVQRTLEYGGQWTSNFDHNVTHVIVEKNISFLDAAKDFPNRHIPEDAVVVNERWFSESINSKYLRDVEQSRFKLRGAPDYPKTPSPRHVPVKRRGNASPSPSISPTFETPIRRDVLEDIIAQVKNAGSAPLDPEVDSISSFLSTGSEPGIESSFRRDTAAEIAVPKENKGFQCMEPHTGEDDKNPNARTIELLQQMATFYDSTGDHWRTTGYRKAISALRQQKRYITTREQALAIPRIGTRLADKIEEIVKTSGLRRLEAIKDDPHSKVLQLFMGIYDVGLKQASQWIQQGHRTLEDLVQKVNLTANQRVGIQRYDDFQQRIPRAEVSEHGRIVRKACWVADKQMQVTIGGSFRRCNKDSGDIDLIISKPGADIAQIRAIVHAKVIPALTEMGFLKYALVSSHSRSGEGSKWLGASCLENSTTWRRIDLLFVPGDELGAALIYFTGNDIFNRSMRLLASRKNMRLNQHGLYKDVMRGPGRTKLTDGTLLESKSEERIFELLGVPWREPYERKC